MSRYQKDVLSLGCIEYTKNKEFATEKIGENKKRSPEEKVERVPITLYSRWFVVVSILSSPGFPIFACSSLMWMIRVANYLIYLPPYLLYWRLSSFLIFLFLKPIRVTSLVFFYISVVNRKISPPVFDILSSRKIGCILLKY